MREVNEAILAAWGRVGPTLSEGELVRRLERRNLASFQRPVRAACFALRASDTRLTEPGAVRRDWVLSKKRDRRRKEGFEDREFVITAADVRRLCSPVVIPRYATLEEMAYLMGMHAYTLRLSMQRTMLFSADVRDNPAGRGWTLYRARHPFTIDPNFFHIRRKWDLDPHLEHLGPSDVWNIDLVGALSRLPEGFRQRIRMVCQKDAWGRKYAMFPCPGCRVVSRRLLFPNAIVPLIPGDVGVPKSIAASAFMPQFMCEWCHRVVELQKDWEGWNRVVSQLSSFRLYGHEVKMPAALVEEWSADRRRFRKSKLTKIVALYQDGVTQKEIAKLMGVSVAHVNVQLHRARIVYGLTRVHNNRRATVKLKREIN